MEVTNYALQELILEFSLLISLLLLVFVFNKLISKVFIFIALVLFFIATYIMVDISQFVR